MGGESRVAESGESWGQRGGERVEWQRVGNHGGSVRGRVEWRIVGKHGGESRVAESGGAGGGVGKHRGKSVSIGDRILHSVRCIYHSLLLPGSVH